MIRSRRRTYGQHMLIEAPVIERIVNSVCFVGTESVCELGTGSGMLTRELCKKARYVTSFEVDKILFEKAKSCLNPFSNLVLVNADPLKSRNLDFDVFVSNIPYSRSKVIMEWLSLQQFDQAILMLQKEFAEKIQSNVGDKSYRAITVVCRYSFHLRNLFAVSKKSFYPVPLVESVVLQLVPRKTPRLTVPIIKNLNMIFSQRHRKASVLNKKFRINQLALDIKIDHLDSDQLVSIAKSAIS
ncbi:MAG: rRNA adenine dimethyltransferase family protein [Nitrososphaeraceae archaeon]|jgi:16S rRNA (adenine1518-N6/adenine1519-N6)-dimethyltransferase